MSKVIHAIYENGVFRPVERVDLPEHTPVEFELREQPGTANGSQPPTQPSMSEGLTRVYAVLGERYESGDADTAARHDEHQP